jgi:nucleotide-binding universal stress UspA family protein
MKILLAIDGSPCSDAAVEEVRKRPWPAASEVKIITAVETPILVGVGVETWPADYYEELQKSARANARAIIDNAVSKLNEVSDKTLKISQESIDGPPREVIVEEAESWGADLIVMGSRGLGVWNRLLLGSVSSAVLHHAKCSVEIVRTPKRAA